MIRKGHIYLTMTYVNPKRDQLLHKMQENAILSTRKGERDDDDDSRERAAKVEEKTGNDKMGCR